MRDESNHDAQKQKKSYTKPEVKQVPLRPEEAVLGFCKIEGEAGAYQADCTVEYPCSEATS